VTAPLAWPGIFFSWALAFLAAAGDYVVPQLVGGANGTMVGVIITDTFQTDYNFPRGAALAFTTLLVSLVIISVVRFVGGKVLR
jgi:spermidine/putrescine transport system permease protein